MVMNSMRILKDCSAGRQTGQTSSVFRDIQLVKLILGIAKNLKVPVIAKGVENESQLKILKELGCELVQGFVFSRPLPPADFESDVISKEISAAG